MVKFNELKIIWLTMLTNYRTITNVCVTTPTNESYYYKKPTSEGDIFSINYKIINKSYQQIVLTIAAGIVDSIPYSTFHIVQLFNLKYQ